MQDNLGKPAPETLNLNFNKATRNGVASTSHINKSRLWTRLNQLLTQVNAEGGCETSMFTDHFSGSRRAADLVCVCVYTVNHKKRGSLFLTITLADLNRFL